MKLIKTITSLFNMPPSTRETRKRRITWISEECNKACKRMLKEMKINFVDKRDLEEICSPSYLSSPEYGAMSGSRDIMACAATIQEFAASTQVPESLHHNVKIFLYATAAEIFLRKALQCSIDTSKNMAIKSLSDDKDLLGNALKPDAPSGQKHYRETDELKETSILRILPRQSSDRILKCSDVIFSSADYSLPNSEGCDQELFSRSEIQTALHLLTYNRLIKAATILDAAKQLVVNREIKEC